MNAKRIPVFINSRDRLSCLQLLIRKLEAVGMERIFILDNSSTYPPLLEFFRSTPHTVVRLRHNYGYLALWESGFHDRFLREHYIYTDPDVVPDEGCPNDFPDRFLELLGRYPDRDKVGFGLRIDDLPDHYALKRQVISHESQFWLDPIESGVYRAPIDTTFALYRPGSIGGYWQRALRTGGAYVARHLPWYSDSRRPTVEDLYYRNHLATGGTHWSEAK